jgi:hypothetical protein
MVWWMDLLAKGVTYMAVAVKHGCVVNWTYDTTVRGDVQAGVGREASRILGKLRGLIHGRLVRAWDPRL